MAGDRHGGDFPCSCHFSMALDVDLIWAGVVLCVPGLDTR